MKTVAGTTTLYHYDTNGLLLAETLTDGTPLRDYIYLQGQPFAVKIYQGQEAGLYYYINDHLGTPQQLVDSSGQIVWQAAYLPFGKAVVVGTVTNNFRFAGQYFDAETGLHYNWHRYYDPEIGRYLKADPIGLQGSINLYAYVLNNPVNLIDPFGLRFSTGHLEGYSRMLSQTGGPPPGIECPKCETPYDLCVQNCLHFLSLPTNPGMDDYAIASFCLFTCFLYPCTYDEVTGPLFQF